jgi:hypothetical protein
VRGFMAVLRMLVRISRTWSPIGVPPGSRVVNTL